MRLALLALLLAAPASAQCLTTTLSPNGGGSIGGAVFFDLDAANAIRIQDLECLFWATAGTPVGVEVWTRAGTHVGFENDPASWTLAGRDDGSALSGGFGVPVPVSLLAAIELPRGATGIALVSSGSGFSYTNGNGSNQFYTDGTVDLTLGTAQNAAFSGSVFQPRVWNGSICYENVESCVSTIAIPNAGGALGGAVYFDVTCARSIRWTSVESIFNGGAGAPIDLRVHLTPGSHVGKELQPAEWSLVAVDNGNAIAASAFSPSRIAFAEALVLPPGSYGIALEVTSHSHSYTTAHPTLQFTDGLVTITRGAATNVPFAGGLFQPRTWNGAVCYFPLASVGASYCGPAVPNTAGLTASILALGSTFTPANSLRLLARDLPPHRFGYFLSSADSGFVAMPGMSTGNLCLGGSIGRHLTGAFDSGAGGFGTLELDLAALPTPTGPSAVGAGETRRFTCWYRDVSSTTTSNFTDAVEVTFF